MQEQYIEQVSPEWEGLVRELIDIALNAPKDADRLRALTYLFDRIIGPTLFEDEDEDDTPLTVADLLAAIRGGQS